MEYYVCTRFLVDFYMCVPEFIETWHSLLEEASPLVYRVSLIADEMRTVNDVLITTTDEEFEAKRIRLDLLSKDMQADLNDIDDIVYQICKAYKVYSDQLDRVIKSGYTGLQADTSSALQPTKAISLLRTSLSAYIYFTSRLGDLIDSRELFNWKLKKNVAAQFKNAFENNAYSNECVNELLRISLLNQEISSRNEISYELMNLV